MNDCLKSVLENLAPEKILLDEPMARHTTFKVGGNADAVFLPSSEEELIQAFERTRAAGIPCMVMGNGSNLIVRDGGIRGLVILLGDNFAEIHVEDCCVTAQAGATLAHIAAVAQANGLTGFEFASGIPGTLGGGCVMNAGAYGGEIRDVLLNARVYTGHEIRVMDRDQMEMGYRSSWPMRHEGIVLGAAFQLSRGEPESILERMKELNARRRDKQPLNYPSAGSVFKRPEGYFAGALIEECGLKGAQIGGAQVSPKHAGFIVNVGNASAEDILQLIRHVQQTVQERKGVFLETEVRIVGEEG